MNLISSIRRTERWPQTVAVVPYCDSQGQRLAGQKHHVEIPGADPRPERRTGQWSVAKRSCRSGRRLVGGAMARELEDEHAVRRQHPHELAHVSLCVLGLHMLQDEHGVDEG